MGSCDRNEEEIYAEKGEGVPIIKRGKGRSEGVYKGAAEEGVYPTIQITTNSTGIFCREKGWKKAHGARLQILK